MVFKPQTFYGKEPDIAEVDVTPGAALEAQVDDALARAGDLDATNISVTEVDGRIVLRGTVAYPEEVAIAEDIASRVSGVASVENLLSAVNADKGAGNEGWQ